MSSSDSYCTPPEVAEPLFEFFGGPVDLDPCSNPYSIIRAHRAYTAGGLHLPWGGFKIPRVGVAKTAYENNPYSKSTIWTRKGIEEMKAHRVLELVRLVMVSTSTAWWKSAMEDAPRNPRLHFTKRLAFLLPRRHNRDVEGGARFDSVLMYYGQRHARFDKCFGHLAQWTRWGR